jgi:hypothetical protein
MHFVVVRWADIEGLEGLGDAGVVDEDVDSAEMFDDLGDGPLDLRFIGNVGRKAEMAFAQGAGGIACGRFIQVENHDAGAVLGERRSGGAANATDGCGAGNDRDFALQKHGGIPRIVFIGSIWKKPMTQLLLCLPAEQCRKNHSALKKIQHSVACGWKLSRRSSTIIRTIVE